MSGPPFCAIHQFKTIVGLKRIPKPAVCNRQQFSMSCHALDTFRPYVSYKYVSGGSRRRSNIIHCRAARDWIDEILMVDDGDDCEESSEMEDPSKAEVGDGEEGVQTSLGATSWGDKALAIAEEVIGLFRGDLEIFSFKVFNRGQVCVRIDKLSNKYGSPGIAEIEKFSNIYSKLLDKAKESGDLPGNLVLEVSSPGAERVVRVPKDLERFKDLPMYVRYVEECNEPEHGNRQHEGVFLLDNIEMKLGYCTWRLANVKLNRKSQGKGRSLSKSKKEWRLRTPFSSLMLVKIYLDV